MLIVRAVEEANRLHKEISLVLESAVGKAIRIGEILLEFQSETEHGDFGACLNRLDFPSTSAYRYMKLAAYKPQLQKSQALGNLQEAYKQVKSLEAQANRTEAQRAADRVREYRKTGEKPDGWRRGTDDKLAEEERGRDARIEAQKAKMGEAEQQRAEQKARREENRQSWSATEEILQQATAHHTEQSIRRREFKERIQVSQSGESDVFIDALMDYLDELDSDSRRIEACQNIIKVCRNIAAGLQVGRE